MPPISSGSDVVAAATIAPVGPLVSAFSTRALRTNLLAIGAVVFTQFRPLAPEALGLVELRFDLLAREPARLELMREAPGQDEPRFVAHPEGLRRLAGGDLRG